MTTATMSRLERLTGEQGKGGGGLPLPPLFQAVLNELLDYGARDVQVLLPAVEEAVLRKSERVKAIYPEDGYVGLVTDALEQLRSRGLVTTDDGQWSLTEKFSPGKPVSVIADRKGRRGHRVTVYEKEERERLSAAATEDRELRAIYSDIQKERTFEVKVNGRLRQLRLHPLARSMRPMAWDEFMVLAQSVKRHGVRHPITVFNKLVLDGRHRLAVAAALRKPLKTESFKGTEDEAFDMVIELNRQLRVWTEMEKAFIVLDHYYPQAKAAAEAQQREAGAHEAGGGRGIEKPLLPRGNKGLRAPLAIEVANSRSGNLSRGRTLQRLLPLLEAPKTRERIERGEIKNPAQAYREAQKERGIEDAPKDVAVTRPGSAYEHIGQIFYQIGRAEVALESGQTGNISKEGFRDRAYEAQKRLAAFIERWIE